MINASLVLVYSHLPMVVDAVHDGTRELVHDIAYRAYQLSQETVPVDTGKLKDEAYVDEISDDEYAVVYAAENTVGNPYGPFVEYGTAFMAAQPFLGPAFRQAQQELEGQAAAYILGRFG